MLRLCAVCGKLKVQVNDGLALRRPRTPFPFGRLTLGREGLVYRLKAVLEPLPPFQRRFRLLLGVTPALEFRLRLLRDIPGGLSARGPLFIVMVLRFEPGLLGGKQVREFPGSARGRLITGQLRV